MQPPSLALSVGDERLGRRLKARHEAGSCRAVVQIKSSVSVYSRAAGVSEVQ